MPRKNTASHGWLAFFGLVQCVLIVVFAVSLGFTLTLGTPKRVAAELTREPSRTALTTVLNRELATGARAGGLMLPADATLVTPAQTAAFVRQTVAASADFKKTVAAAALLDDATTQARRLAARHHLRLSAKQWRVIDAAMQTRFTKDMNELMQTGVGSAYGMLVLILQTMTIVAAILMAINLGLMALSAHSLRRWLKVNGRLLYVLGFLGGSGALLAGVPALSATWQLAQSPVGIVTQLIQAFAPTWQRVAGIIVVIGLIGAGAAHLFDRRYNKL